MNVKELKKHLEQFDEQLVVYLSADGHWLTGLFEVSPEEIQTKLDDGQTWVNNTIYLLPEGADELA